MAVKPALYEERDKALAEAQKANDLLESDSQNAEYEERYQKAWGDFERLDQSITRQEQLDAAESRMASTEDEDPLEATGQKPDPAKAGLDEFRSSGDAKIDRYLKYAYEMVEQRTVNRFLLGDEYRQHFNNAFLREGQRLPGIPMKEFSEETRSGLMVGSDTKGGYLAPMQLAAGILKSVDDAVTMRRDATIFSMPNADSLGVMKLDSDPGAGTWGGEISEVQEDDSMALGMREMNPTENAELIKVSMRALRKVPGIETLVRSRAAYVMGITLETAYMIGSGVNQPLGVFTAAASGIPTSRDVQGTNTATELKADTFLDMVYSLKAQHLARAKWKLHRTVMKAAAKLKYADGTYIFRHGQGPGVPPTLCDLPYDLSEYAPNTMTANQYVAVLGNFDYYYIVDSMQFTIQRLVEKYATSRQEGLIIAYEGDGQPVLAEAFSRMQMGS